MEDLQAALDREFQQVWMPTPPILYRYVPAHFAQDIRDGSLFASNLQEHARKTDKHEFLLGWNLIRSTAAASAAQAPDDLTLRELCNRIADDKNPFDETYDAFAVCLTSQPDAEHMWSTFGAGGGSRFGFQTHDLLAGLKRHQATLYQPGSDGLAFVGSPPRLLPVHYEADDLITAVEDMIHKVTMPKVNQRKANAPALDPLTAANIPLYALRDVFVPMALSFKRARFKSEREWRIVFTGARKFGAPARKGIKALWADEKGTPAPLPIIDEVSR